jgi:hypothetical protein
MICLKIGFSSKTAIFVPRTKVDFKLKIARFCVHTVSIAVDPYKRVPNFITTTEIFSSSIHWNIVTTSIGSFV